MEIHRHMQEKDDDDDDDFASLLRKTAVQYKIFHASHILKSKDVKLLLSDCLLTLRISKNSLHLLFTYRQSEN